MFAAECTDTQLHSFVQLVVHAAELMQQPRSHSDAPLNIEVTFADLFGAVVEKASGTGLDARLVQLLEGAWLRLRRSGVLQARGIEASCTSLPDGQAYTAAIMNSLSAPGLRHCALHGCGAREAHKAHFKRCAACQAVVYCSRECQATDWPAHKEACKAARKAAAAAEEAGPSGA